MRTARWIVAMGVFGALSLGCGDDGDDNSNANVNEQGATSVCKEQCARGKECALFDDSNYPQAECIKDCEDQSKTTMASGDCKFSDAQIKTCVAALSKQSCADLTVSVPSECEIECTVPDSK